MKLENSILVIEYPSINKYTSLRLLNSLINTKFYKENYDKIIVSTYSQGFSIGEISKPDNKLCLIETSSTRLSYNINGISYIPFYEVRKLSHTPFDYSKFTYSLIVDDDIEFSDSYFDVICNSIKLLKEHSEIGMVYHSYRRRKTKLAGVHYYEIYNSKIHGRQECGLGQLMRNNEASLMYDAFNDYKILPFGAGEDKFSMVYTKYNLKKSVVITYEAINKATLSTPTSEDDAQRRLCNPNYNIALLRKTPGSMLNILANNYNYYTEKDF